MIAYDHVPFLKTEGDNLLIIMPHTGEICQRSGIYGFAGHVDRTTGCHPTSEERQIPLSKGERFPPIRSCGKAANWVFVRDA